MKRVDKMEKSSIIKDAFLNTIKPRKDKALTKEGTLAEKDTEYNEERIDEELNLKSVQTNDSEDELDEEEENVQNEEN